MSSASAARPQFRGAIPRNASRFLYVARLPGEASSEALYKLFSPFGSVTQIVQGFELATKGTAIVVFDDVLFAHRAATELNGYNYHGRFLQVNYYMPEKFRPEKCV